MPVRVPTVPSSDFFSRPSSWARFGSFQMPGSANSFSTSARRFCLPSRSKIPPQLLRPLLQVGERGGELVEAFGFHGGLNYTARVRAVRE
jgi:hypothetical protein